MEHFVLKKLRDDPAFVPEPDYVMEKDGPYKEKKKLPGQLV